MDVLLRQGKGERPDDSFTVALKVEERGAGPEIGKLTWRIDIA